MVLGVRWTTIAAFCISTALQVCAASPCRAAERRTKRTGASALPSSRRCGVFCALMNGAVGRCCLKLLYLTFYTPFLSLPLPFPFGNLSI